MSVKCFADVHQHVLWGMDDGPRTAEEMHALLTCAVGEGMVRIAATSHAYPGVKEFDIVRYQERLAEANEFCQQQGWALRLVQGCEIHYCKRVPDLLAAGKLPTLGGTRYALIEFPYAATLNEIERATNQIYQAGFQPVAAHVERYRCLSHSPKEAISAHRDLGLLFQMNCETILNPHGFFERRFVQKMLAQDAIDVIATDAHDTKTRPIKMRATFEKISQQNEQQAQRMAQMAWKLIGEGNAC